VVLEDQSDEPIGVVTKTDVLEALTWEQEDRNAVQVFGPDLLDGMDYDGVSALIENMTSKYGASSVIKASIELHEHKEQSRGMPLVLARIRLVTDRGYFTADGEGYGASRTLRLAANKVERQIPQGKHTGGRKSVLTAESKRPSMGGGSRVIVSIFRKEMVIQTACRYGLQHRASRENVK